jgi:hypothetical protein
MRRDRDRDLPDDLALLGLYLEVAAGESVRRRARRQALANFIGAVSVAVPFALAVAAADLSPADGLLPRPPVISLDAEPPTNAFMVRHIPDEPLPPPKKEVCLDARDCPAPVHPTVTPAPAGKH